jgi:hypothetical protein
MEIAGTPTLRRQSINHPNEIGQVTCWGYNADKRQASTLILLYKKNLRLQPKPLY